jgi:hypothetical protein
MNARYLRLTASLAFACGALVATQASAAITVKVLSSMPQLVTGDNALVQVAGATVAPTVSVGGKDVSSAFSKDASGNYIGLVAGLAKGSNELAVTAGADKASVTLVNHASNDTLFAGPQQTPFLCQNEAHGLAKATDATCAAPSTITWQYRDRMGAMKPFDPKGARPADIATVKIGGKDVPVIVMTEKGVINRAAYQIQMIHDPATGPAPTPTNRGTGGWNGKLVFGFGPGVGAGYMMGANVGGVNVALLNEGFATAGASLAVFGTQPSDLLSAETMAKVKEHFIETYGAPVYTLGQGGSGGSMQQQQIANAYPGLLDGIMPERLYADQLTFLQPLYDCELLVNVFKQGTWTRAQMDAVSGKYWGFCVSNGSRYPRAQVDRCNGPVAEMIDKDPALKANPPRCTVQENLANVFGKLPNGNARNPYDNVGVQYGLKALNDGVITIAQFIDINTRIGGHDANGKIAATRQVGDEQALKAAYATGRVNTTANIQIPVIDWRTYIDGDPFGRGDANVDVHDRYHSEIVRARFQKYNPGAANYVAMLVANGAVAAINNDASSPASVARVDAYAALDKWLTAIAQDTSNRTLAQKVAANKPAGLVDTCYAVQGGAYTGRVEKITDWARCEQIFPRSADARIAAGAPLTDDVLKCQLKPVAASDYKVAPTADQLAQIQKIFPQGVCDYSKPGVGFVAKATTWAVFKGDGTWVGI